MTYIVPSLILLLFLYAAIKHTDPFDAFIEGAKEAIPLLMRLIPNMAAILAAITLFSGSGALDVLTSLLRAPSAYIGVPPEIVHLLLMRPLSGSASLGILSDILIRYGPDSFVGLCASVCVGSTETVLYVIPMYCGTYGIRHTRYIMPAALVSGFVGIIIGILLVRIML